MTTALEEAIKDFEDLVHQLDENPERARVLRAVQLLRGGPPAPRRKPAS